MVQLRRLPHLDSGGCRCSRCCQGEQGAEGWKGRREGRQGTLTGPLASLQESKRDPRGRGKLGKLTFLLSSLLASPICSPRLRSERSLSTSLELSTEVLSLDSVRLPNLSLPSLRRFFAHVRFLLDPSPRLPRCIRLQLPSPQDISTSVTPKPPSSTDTLLTSTMAR
jgi:hypothetical protein